MSEPQYQAGYKLRDLKAFITTCVGDKIAKRMTAEMQEVQLILAPKNMGHGLDLMTQRYKAEFYFDRFPFKEYDPAVLFANVAAWLMDNDDEREYQPELGDPEVDVVLEDQNAAEIIIEVMFEEPVKVIEDENGPIYWSDKRYRIEEYEVWVANKLRQVNIGHAPNTRG